MDWNLRMLDKQSKRNYGIALALLVLFGTYFAVYCSSIMIEFPYQSWFDQIPLIDLFYTGELTLDHLISPYAEHGMFATNILWIINCLFFHGSSLFDVYLYDIMAVITAAIVFCGTLVYVKDTKQAAFWLLMEAMFLFICFQGAAAAMETQIRLGMLFFVITMIFVDREFRNVKCTKGSLILTLVLIVLSINFFGTLYSFAGVPLVWLIFLVTKNKKPRHWLIAITYVLTIFLYVWQYEFTMPESGDGSGSALSILNPISILMAGISWSANGVLGWAYCMWHRYNDGFYLLAGSITLIATFWSIYLFVKHKLYTKTWLPLMLIVYSIGVAALVYLGRGRFGWEWMMNEWYTFHIRLQTAGAAWIFAMVFVEKPKTKIENVVNRVIPVSLTLIMCLYVAFGSLLSWKRAPSVRAYYESKQPYLLVEDSRAMPIDENGMTPLVHDLHTTMKAIEILDKYDLSVYHNEEEYEAIKLDLALGTDLRSIQEIAGVYEWEDAEKSAIWTSATATMKVSVGEDGKAYLKAYCPSFNLPDTMRIYYNGELMDTIEITEENVDLSFELPPRTEGTLEIVLDHAYAPSEIGTGLDARPLGLCLYELFIR